MAMDAQVEDDRIHRQFRRYQLALRLMAHQARTRTICAMTALTHHQLAHLRKRWRVTQDMRRRGPSPRSFAVFFHSPRARSEAASLAVLLRILDALPSPRIGQAGKSLLSLEVGEKLCEAFETYRACVPAADLEFEQVVMLAVGLAQGNVIGLGHCEKCRCAVLIDRLGTRRRACSYCQTLEGLAESHRVDRGFGSADESYGGPEVIQAALF